MKLKSSLALLVLAGTLFLGAFYPNVDIDEKEGMIFHALLSVMDQVHFDPKVMDDDFSKKVFDQYLKSIDGSKRFLVQEDIDQLKTFQTQIDDEARNRTLEFFDLSLDVIENADDRAKLLYEELVDLPFDLSKEETIELDGEKKAFAKDRAELREYWRKSLKYEIIAKVNRMVEEQKDKMNEELEEGEEAPVIKTTQEFIEEAREDVKEVFDDWFDRKSKLRRSDHFEVYLNSFTHIFDPHSDYFNPKEKQDFDIRMGGKLEGIGARLQTDGDYTKVVSIVTGGPAWKGKQLEVGDMITAVTQQGQEGVDILDMRIDDVVQMIRGTKGSVVILTVKKKDDGKIVDIEIERDIVEIDDSKARSVILDKDEEVKNIGFIRLPSFYSEFQGKEGNSCAEDIRQEIEKLKAQNVEGIILDLRYNGGGSLRDVITMSGLFIEEGPIVQVKPRGRKPYVYEDEDESVSYDGPLIVLVNSYSASASEILVAALQDYERAIIVGSNSTFGKGTVQRFFDLDRAIRGNAQFKPLGEVKLTMQKYYRINGGSTQLRGVLPDIVLPDRYSFIDVGEKEYDYAMEWTEINPVVYNQEVLDLPDLTGLASKSKARVQTNGTFQRIQENAMRLKNIKDVSEFPLSLEGYNKVMSARKAEAKKFEDLNDEPVDGLVAKNLEIDLSYIQMDSVRIAKNEDFIKGIQKDVYLEEAMFIIRDLIAELPSQVNTN